MNGDNDWYNMYISYCTKVLMPMRKLKSLEIISRWVRLTKKVNQKLQLKSNKIYSKWARLTRDIVQISRSRKLYVQKRLGRLAKKVVVIDMFTRSMISEEKLRSMVLMQLKKQQVQTALKSRLDFRRLADKLLSKQTSMRVIRWLS